MKPIVDHIDWVDEIEWGYFVQDCPWATFFESPDWILCQDVQNNLQLSGSGLKLRFNDSTELIFPISKKKVLKGFQQQLSGVPGGLYGGPLSKGDINSDHLIIAIEIIQQKYANLDIRLNPFLFQYLNIDPTYFTLISDTFTQFLDLKQSLNAINQALSSNKINYDTRYAKKHNVSIRSAQSVDLNLFMGVYESMIKKWGKANIEYTSDFFEILISRKNCDFWSFYKDDKYIGGGILLKQNHHVSSWLTIVQADYLKYRPYEFVYNYLINHYKTLGFHWFDFNPSAGLDGVISFKEKFGTQKLIIPTIQQSSSIVQLSNKLRKNNRNA